MKDLVHIHSRGIITVEGLPEAAKFDDMPIRDPDTFFGLLWVVLDT